MAYNAENVKFGNISSSSQIALVNKDTFVKIKKKYTDIIEEIRKVKERDGVAFDVACLWDEYGNVFVSKVNSFATDIENNKIDASGYKNICLLHTYLVNTCGAGYLKHFSEALEKMEESEKRICGFFKNYKLPDNQLIAILSYNKSFSYELRKFIAGQVYQGVDLSDWSSLDKDELINYTMLMLREEFCDSVYDIYKLNRVNYQLSHFCVKNRFYHSSKLEVGVVCSRIEFMLAGKLVSINISTKGLNTVKHTTLRHLTHEVLKYIIDNHSYDLSASQVRYMECYDDKDTAYEQALYINKSCSVFKQEINNKVNYLLPYGESVSANLDTVRDLLALLGVKEDDVTLYFTTI